jgi:hypothetical protein
MNKIFLNYIKKHSRADNGNDKKNGNNKIVSIIPFSIFTEGLLTIKNNENQNYNPP